jgi:LPXTG-motif cell wall-anchored protein
MLMPTGDTTPTNCTALREEAEKLAKQTSSGSMGIGALIITGFIYLWRRRKSYIFG